MKKIILFLIISSVTIASGCSFRGSTTTKVISAPISKDRSQLVVDGETTKTDIITMFGMPNGFIEGMVSYRTYATNPSQEQIYRESNILHYKDCVIVSSSSGKGFGGFYSSGSSARMKCKVFTALLDKKDTVIAHTYLEDNTVTEEVLTEIIKNKSTKKDVVRLLGGPTSITTNGNEEIYIYKDCITTTQVRGPFGPMNMSSDQNCQISSIVMNKKSGVVKKVNLYPNPAIQ
jgi:hypothetical protein